MAIELNHTIVNVEDQARGAAFLTDLFGLAPAKRFGPFHVVEVANGVSLDYLSTDGAIHMQHFAFLVSEEEFTTIFGRIVDRHVPYWADPARQRPGEINHHDGGRGVYFTDPDGHVLEIITRPYGSGEKA